MQLSTLVLILRKEPVPEILLGFKKVGFGKGKYTGFGGKVQIGETIPEAASRELLEESGIQISPDQLRLQAILEFHFPEKLTWSQEVHLFIADDPGIEPIESNEMSPRWFRYDEIPYLQMWDDSHYWLPQALAGEKFQAIFTFKVDNEQVDQVTQKGFPEKG